MFASLPTVVPKNLVEPDRFVNPKFPRTDAIHMAVPEKVIDLSLQQSVWIMHGILPPETPDIEPLPWGWAAVTFGCDHERYPRHRCESFRYNVLVREFMVAWG